MNIVIHYHIERVRVGNSALENMLLTMKTLKSERQTQNKLTNLIISNIFS